MMLEKNADRMEELEIDIKDLMKYVCLRWRLVLAWMVIGALVFGGIGAIKVLYENRTAQQVAEMSKEESEQSRENKLAVLKAELTEVEIAEVECVFEAYNSTIFNSGNIASYNKESIKMQLNPYAVPTINLSYYIDNHYQAVYPIVQEKDSTNAIMAALTEEVTSVTTCERIVQELNWEKESIYVAELIGVGYVGNVLSITLMAPKQEECQVMRAIMMEILDERVDKLQQVFGTFDATVIEDEYKLSVNTALLSEQMAMNSSMYNLKNNYAMLVSGLSEQQQEYLDELINMPFQEEGNVEIVENVENNDEGIPARKLFKLKYVLFGTLLGAFLYCSWLMMKYVLSNKLHTAEEIEQRYCVRIMAIIVGMRKEKKPQNSVVDKVILRAFEQEALKVDKEKAIRLLKSEISVLIKNGKMKNIYVASTSDTVECKEIQKLVCEESKDSSYAIYGGCDISCNPEELEVLGRSDGVVFIEQIDSSSYKKMKSIVCFCEQNQIPIIGCAVVQ